MLKTKKEDSRPLIDRDRHKISSSRKGELLSRGIKTFNSYSLHTIDSSISKGAKKKAKKEQLNQEGGQLQCIIAE